MKINTLLFLITGLILAVSNFLAIHLFLYWRYIWLDKPMHLLGGCAAALGLFVLYDIRLPLPSRFLRFSYFMGFIFLVTITWEIFEAAIGAANTAASYYVFDSITDILAGLLGGSIGWLVGSRTEVLNNLNN